jgi:hypothetical protein
VTRHPPRGAAQEPQIPNRNLLKTRGLVPHGSSLGPSGAEKELVESGALVRATDPGPIFALQRDAMATRRTKSISTKVTATEYDAVLKRAGPLKVSEWARDILLGAAQPDPFHLLLLAELLALRTIVLNLHFAVAANGPPTAEAMQSLIDRADAEKWKRAEERIARLRAAGDAKP